MTCPTSPLFFYWGLTGLSQGWKPKAGEWSTRDRAMLADWTAALGLHGLQKKSA